MKVQSLGHVVLNVADLARSEAFYTGVLGLPVCARYDEGGMEMTFFSLGNHHDLAISKAAPTDTAPARGSVGLNHVAFCIGTSLDELREAKTHLEAAGLDLTPIDHEVTKSLYLQDPDGNGVELYVDVSDVWREQPQRVAQARALEI